MQSSTTKIFPPGSFALEMKISQRRLYLYLIQIFDSIVLNGALEPQIHKNPCISPNTDVDSPTSLVIFVGNGLH